MKTVTVSRRCFWIVSILSALILSGPAKRLLPLYRDPELRSAVQRSMNDVAEARGWLVSDLTILCEFKSSRWGVLHTDHVRLETPSEYVELDSSLPRCEG
jgi:hypothetical protein